MDGVSRRRAMWMGSAVAVSFALPRSVKATTGLPLIAAYRNPGCGCCEKWAEQLKLAGFPVTLEDDPNLDAHRARLGVPAELAGCHTALVGDYIIEGHVPPGDILSLLTSRPKARGLAVPGMPTGSPGMETGGTADVFDVLVFTEAGDVQVYARH